MLYYIKEAEFYHKSQRSYLLSRSDENFTEDWWSSLKEVDFGPNEQAKEGSFNFIGLDKLNLSPLLLAAMRGRVKAPAATPSATGGAAGALRSSPPSRPSEAAARAL